MERIKGWIPDFKRKRFFFGEIIIDGEIILGLEALEKPQQDTQTENQFILPGLVDAHVHIESSMLIPSVFAREVLKFGTLACVSDPHEIANVLGMEGIAFMIKDAEQTPLKITFTAPSCVPATAFEYSGAELKSDDLALLAEKYKLAGLGEMMNFPGVINKDKDVMEKISLFKRLGLPIDGHAPGLRGRDLRKYIDAGISTDHEASSIEEAREKIKNGMKILIREGSAARNFDALWPLIEEYPDEVMLCCDDIHPDDLIEHHIDQLIVRGLKKGLNIFDLLKAASVNPVKHYKLDVGLLKQGDKADFIVVENLDEFKVKESYINGKCVFRNGSVQYLSTRPDPINKFKRERVKSEDFELKGEAGTYRVIGVKDGDLFTSSELGRLDQENGIVMPDNEQDIIRIAVINRYVNTAPSLGWIKNTGLRSGALASSIAHDSHNIIVMGISTQDMADAVNLIVDSQGGISYSSGQDKGILPLPVAGLMSDQPASWVGQKYGELTQKVKDMGSSLASPFMTLSFMALLVIPELKIGDRGLFDGKEFKFVDPKTGD